MIEHFALMTLAAATDSWFTRLLDSLDISEPWQIWLFFFGLLGQVTFFMRWIFQWIASERRGRSHVPEVFWWSSLIGAFMLLIYFAIRREPIGVLGQMTGWAVYARNLYLVHQHRKAGEPVDTPDTAPLDEVLTDDICPACGRPRPATGA